MDYYTPEDRNHTIWPNPIFIPDRKHYLTILAQALKDARSLPEHDDFFDYVAEQLTDAGLTYEQAVYLMYHNSEA